MKGIAFTILFLGALGAPAFGQSAQQGEALYGIYCAQCHGIEGNGKGINVEHMSVLPRDHTNRAEMGGRSDDELFRVIEGGGRVMNLSVLMPAWKGNLNEDEIRALVRYLRVLCCEPRD